ncbi:type VI secretion system-associated protein TagF [Bosea sp. LjRoot90]|uniref:type VI secretion system-associated protein TagF n=1 Tax=Bosea sp. LjRoot90 TaxID=3342342 RepID=UPI003ECE8FF3
MSEAPAFGLFGKVPWAGDFVQQGLPSRFVKPWEVWLLAMLAASREALGSRWDDAYLLSPPWRFQLAPGVIGASGWAGVFASSVDRVRRHYPLTLALELPGEDGAGFAASEGLLDLFEVAVLELIATERSLPDALASLRRRLDAQRATVSLWLGPGSGRLVVDGEAERLSPAAADRPAQDGASHWWHGRWSGRPATALRCEGLPDPAACAGFFSGDWSRHGWRTAAVRQGA